MLKTLSVKNYVLIDSLEIDFPEGLIIITGQTGAGKSILLGALSLVMGAKADASAIAEGADSCVVEAVFGCGENDTATRELLEANDLEWDGGSLIVRRVVYRSGRSRSFINDCPVQLQLLSSVTSRLIDIHSQHQSLQLCDRSFQLSVLDHFAGNSGLLAEYRTLWNEHQKLVSERKELRLKLERLSAEKDYNEAQFQQLDEARLIEGELEELETEQRQLSNVEEIKETLCRAESSLEPERDDCTSPSMALKECSNMLSRLREYLPEAEELSSRLDSVRIELDDIASEISSLNSGMDASPERLEQVEDRLGLLYDLMKKHNCRTIEELIETRERYSSYLFDSGDLQDRLDAADARISELEKQLDKSAEALSTRRAGAAGPLGKAVTDSLAFLELDRAVFEIRLAPVQTGPDGRDAVSFLFTSTGRNAVDVSRCASGGEISRIMLSLKALMAGLTAMPTLIFDEIDTGVSGSVAAKMGNMICRMGRSMQVFAITHLPQVAAQGDAHYVVEKKTEGEGNDARTLSHIRELGSEERVFEVARLLSGASLSDEAVANARALLAESGC